MRSPIIALWRIFTVPGPALFATRADTALQHRVEKQMVQVEGVCADVEASQISPQ